MKEVFISEEIKKLSTAERIILAEDLWDSISADQEKLAVTAAQKQELDERLSQYHSSPGEGSSWDEVKHRVKTSK